jgi:hypothetical protein
MICRAVNGRLANAFGEGARRIPFDLVLQIGPAAMVRKLFFVSYSRAYRSASTFSRAPSLRLTIVKFECYGIDCKRTRGRSCA